MSMPISTPKAMNQIKQKLGMTWKKSKCWN